MNFRYFFEKVEDQKKVVKEHVLSVHKTSKNYSCENCNYLARNKRALINHMKVHNVKKHSEAESSKRRLGTCQVCKFKTYSEAALIEHLMSNHAKWE